MASERVAEPSEQATALQNDLNAALNDLEADPTASLNASLFVECRQWLIPTLDAARRGILAARISKCLESIQNDPAPLVELLESIIDPFSFTDILKLGGSIDFAAGLNLKAHQSFNNLFLFILTKATHDLGDAEAVAMMPGVIHALVELWLLTPDTGTSCKASQTLVSLLEIDKGPPLGLVDAYGNNASSPGLVWKRVFGDSGIYALIFGICSFKINEPKLSNKERSTSQARLLDIAPDLARLDWSYVVRSHHAEIEHAAGLQPNSEGFLDFVLQYMIDKDDILMHIALLSTFTHLISKASQPSLTNAKCSNSVEYLIQRGIHSQTISLWVSPDKDSVDSSFLLSPSSEYLSTYTLWYPEHFLGDGENVKSILTHLAANLKKSPGQWAQAGSSQSYLLVLQSLPRICLLPQKWLIADQQISSPFLLLPSKAATPATLSTLGNILGCTPRPGFWNVSTTQEDRAAGRVLYLLYIASHPTFFDDLITHADTVALLETAQTAIEMVLIPLLQAKWAPLPSTSKYDENQPPATTDSLPSEDELVSLISASNLVAIESDARYTGLSNILFPSVANKIIAWLFKPPRMFSNLVGGRGDTEGAAYKVAQAKFFAICQLQKLLVENTEDSIENVRAALIHAVNTRVAEGLWGRASEVGGRIATLEL